MTRRYQGTFVVRLGDADEFGQLRLDGVARFLQDVATDDWVDTGVESNDVWVVRRTLLRRLDLDRWPKYLDRLTLTTWCSGVGAAWAERRTTFELGGITLLEANALWVPTDSSGQPVRLRQSFFDVYGEAVRERKVSSRIATAPQPRDASRRPWPLRRSDVDVVGHVNNAAVWLAVADVLSVPQTRVCVTHHAPIEWGDDVSLVTAPGALWLDVDGAVRVSVEYGD